MKRNHGRTTYLSRSPGPLWRALVVAIAGLGIALSTSRAELLDVEKDELTFGFIKLTDCAPLVIAKEKLFFEEEGLEVKLEAQANWKILLDRVISGELDGAHMLAGQPIGATIGFGTQAHIITPYSLDYNGNGITVSNELWEAMQGIEPKLNVPQPQHPITADALLPIVQTRKSAGVPLRMGMVFPVSTHNYEIRYWLAAAGISPGILCRSPVRLHRRDRNDRCRRPALGHSSAADAGHARGKDHRRVLRRRTLEPAGGDSWNRCAGHDELRHLEEQSGEGLRNNEGMG